MFTLDDIDPLKAIKALIWGAPGAGKTSLAGTFPKVAFVDTDFGIRVLKSRDFIEREGEPDLVGYRQFKDAVDPKTGLFKSAEAFWDIIEFINELEENPEVETIVIDSLTSLQDLAMNVGMELSGQHGRSKSLSRAKKRGKIPVAIPTQADFGSEMSAFTQLMDAILDSKKHCLFLAHEREQYNDKGMAVRREPLLIGSAVRGRVGKWFDEVWYIDTNNRGDRELKTKSTGILQGLKSRGLSLPDGMKNPNYEKIMEAAMT